MNSTGNFIPTKLKQNGEVIFTFKHKLIEISQVALGSIMKKNVLKVVTTFFRLDSSFKRPRVNIYSSLSCLHYSDVLFC